MFLLFCLLSLSVQAKNPQRYRIIRDVTKDASILNDYRHHNRIPKIIHYIWVGPNPKSNLVVHNIMSWRRYCPDCFIIEWNDYNLYPVALPYLREAYEEAHYAYVADYFRLYLIHRFGGIYMDSDVELLRPIDKFFGHNFFMGHEINQWNQTKSGAHMFGSAPGNKMLAELLHQIEQENFRNKDGTLNILTLPKRMDRYFMNEYNLSIEGNPDTIISLGNRWYLYPWWYFNTPASDKIAYAHHSFTNTYWAERLTITKQLTECITDCQGKHVVEPRNPSKKNTTQANLTTTPSIIMEIGFNETERLDAPDFAGEFPSLQIKILLVIIIGGLLYCLFIYRKSWCKRVVGMVH